MQPDFWLPYNSVIMKYSVTLNKRCFSLLLLLSFCFTPLSAAAKLVIAQGGASGYLMGHNLPSLALAVAMDADIIKLDVVMTGDNEVIVFGSPTLGRASNVTEIFPDRAREDAQYYVLDFTLDEIRQLTLQDPAGRFPAELSPRLTIPTLDEALALLGALDRSLAKLKKICIAVEIKQPWLHRKEGKDISKPVLSILQKYNYTGQTDNVFILSYDTVELKRISRKLLPEMQMSIKLVQLVESNEGQESMTEEWGEWVSYNYDWMFSKSGLRSLGGTVAAIGLPKYMLADSRGKLLLESFVENAHQLGTMIFTYPVQKDEKTRLPFISSFEEELGFFYFTVGVDGVMTDFCGDAVKYLKKGPTPPTIQMQQGQSVPPSIEMVLDDPLQLTSPAPVLEIKE